MLEGKAGTHMGLESAFQDATSVFRLPDVPAAGQLSALGPLAAHCDFSSDDDSRTLCRLLAATARQGRTQSPNAAQVAPQRGLGQGGVGGALPACLTYISACSELTLLYASHIMQPVTVLESG